MFLTGVRPFEGADHSPFFLPGGESAALLIHGFPGSPKEMRAIGESLNGQGWTVQAILLPGFGPEIETLPERRHTEWVEAVRSALIALQREHSPVLLLGFSMGGAVSLQVATDVRPDALVLLAPFWQFGARWQDVAWPAARLVVRQFRPFRYADFSDPRIRGRIASLLPGFDLDAPEVRRFLRDLRVPTRVLDQVHRVGRRAYRVAPRARLRTIVVQGIHDTIVRPDQTRRLLRRLPGPLRYVEVEAAHDLVDPHHPAWPEVEAAVLQFALRSHKSGRVARSRPLAAITGQLAQQLT